MDILWTQSALCESVCNLRGTPRELFDNVAVIKGEFLRSHNDITKA